MIPVDARLPQDGPGLVRQLSRLWAQLAGQVNGAREGRIASANAFVAAPTAGEWHIGDFVRNSAPAEAGTAGSKYVVLGWVCVGSGSPGTWVACRCLTGN